MPEVKEKKNWWTEPVENWWANKWFGGGPLGSAMWRPSQWFRGGPTQPGVAQVTPQALARLKELGLDPSTMTQEQMLAALGPALEQEAFGQAIWVIPGQLKKTPDGRYFLPDGSEVEAVAALRMLDQYEAGFGPEPMSAYEQANVDLARQELEWKMSQGGGAGAQWRPGELQLQQEQLALQEKIWQTGLKASPRDWIERWYAMRPPAPKRGFMPGTVLPEVLSWGPRGGKTPAERRFLIDRWLAQGESPENIQALTETMPVYGFHPERVTQQEIIPAGYRTEYTKAPIASPEWAAAHPELRAAFEVDLKARRKERERVQRPKAPPTPYWLPPVSPGQITGAELERLPVKTPSMQLFETMPWSAREGLAGYMDWYGGKAYQDLLNEMEMMRPVPVRPQRWIPSRR